MPSVFTVLIWGPITDAIGRKKAMVFVPIVNGARALVYFMNSYFVTAHPAYLLLGSFLSCFYGEFQGVVALCYAYMADVTVGNLNQRTMRMAFIEAGVFGAGIPAGLLSGYLLQRMGYVPVFILTFCLNLLVLLYVICFLPRSIVPPACKVVPKTDATSEIAPEQSVDQTGSRSLFNPFFHFRKVYKVIIDRECRRTILPLILAFGFSVCAVLGELIVQTLYLKNKPFNFTYQSIGYYSAAQSAIRGIGVILITQLSFHFFHLDDYTLIIIGLVSQMICYVLIGLSRSTSIVYLVNITSLAVPVATTTLRSLATKNVSQRNYGSVLAAMEATDAIAGVTTNCVSLWTYNLTLTVYTGVVYFALAGLSFLSLLIIILTRVL